MQAEILLYTQTSLRRRKEEGGARIAKLQRMERGEEAPLTHADNEEFLRILRDRMIELGIQLPKMEVRFENLFVEASMHTGRHALPTLFNAVINSVQEMMGFLNFSPTKKRSIKLLDGVKGLIRPSRMTLVLGPPGSGKSTLLRTLSGKLDPTLKFTGRVTYNGEELSPSTPQCVRAYVSQHDLHHAEMTVRDTLDFSGRMFGTSKIFEMLGEAFERKNGTIKNKLDLERDAIIKATTCGESKNPTTNYIIKMLGLYECADTIIGDEMRRGISGGQRKE
ncbi:ABC transporter G family member 45-like [Phoenix dactylifera]|uniref:ABC transporter G family member 45-like n=1 Tax=Phoenix dactylifera TaxID=42345 RepID=A0A8B8ZQV0_PHODC|nr:ABC transporter G family member 45-like [Phoenix dactylifera]